MWRSYKSWNVLFSNIEPLFHLNLDHPGSSQTLNLQSKSVRSKLFLSCPCPKGLLTFKSSLTIWQVSSVLSDTVTVSQLRKHHRHAEQQNVHAAKLKAAVSLRINCPLRFKHFLTLQLKQHFYFESTFWFISYGRIIRRQNWMFWWAHASSFQGQRSAEHEFK